MLPPYIFSRYIASSYLRSYLVVLGVVVFGLAVSNSFDVINRYRSVDISIVHFLQLVLFKIPYLIGEISFFVGFIATLYFFRRIKNSQELTALFASGLSMTKIVVVIVILQLFIGIFFTAVIGHIGPAMLNRIDQLEMRIGGVGGSSNIQSIIFRKQIILREGYDNGARVYKTSYIDATSNRLGELVVVMLDKQGRYQGAYFASEALLMQGEIRIPQALYRGSDGIATEKTDIIMSTDLTIDNFTDSVLAPENISFWRMNSKIRVLEKLGMPIVNYQLYHAKVLFRALTLVVWVMIAVSFVIGYSSRVEGNQLQRILFPLLIIGCGYTLMDSVTRLLLQYSIRPYEAVFLPQGILLFIASFMILQLHED